MRRSAEVEVHQLRLRECPGIKFCGECGQRLGEPPKSSAVPDPVAYTPKHLAEKILTSRSALEGERKQVTVLFADVWRQTVERDRAHPPARRRGAAEPPVRGHRG
jgi:hypothetical protein